MNSTIKFLDLKDTTARCSGEIKEAVERVIDSGRYLHGEATEELERMLAETCETEFAVGVSNGLDAIRLILRANIELGRLKPGDKVIAPANTYIASILPIEEFGLRTLLIEPDPVSMNLDLKRAAEAAADPDVKAVIAVHLYGNPCWGEELNDLASRGIMIIEDNAQGIGARSATAGIHGTHATGGLGHAAAISFYPTKNVGALGDAGGVTTNDPELAGMIRTLANYGADRRYHNICCGYNCRMDEIQAAILGVKMRRLQEETKMRREAADTYLCHINRPGVILPHIARGDEAVWHQFVIRNPRRDELKSYLEANGVGTDIHYAVPPHKQPCFEGRFKESLPIAETMANEILSLPIANITPQQATRVAEIINSFQ